MSDEDQTFAQVHLKSEDGAIMQVRASSIPALKEEVAREYGEEAAEALINSFYPGRRPRSDEDRHLHSVSSLRPEGDIKPEN